MQLLNEVTSYLKLNCIVRTGTLRRYLRAPGRVVLMALLMACSAHSGKRQAPVLAFPEPGVDNPEVYRDYTTRFYRDAHRNTVQIYIRQNAGRVVNLWANALNQSLGFTVRDAQGRPVHLNWAAEEAEVGQTGTLLTLSYQLEAPSGLLTFGHFLLGSMRFERDFQYLQGHRKPFSQGGFVPPEFPALIENLARLPEPVRRKHLEALNAHTVEEKPPDSWTYCSLPGRPLPARERYRYPEGYTRTGAALSGAYCLQRPVAESAQR